MAQGKEAWNNWATRMLAEKSPIGTDKAWADRARADFRGVNFNEDCIFAGFVFPSQVVVLAGFKKRRAGFTDSNLFPQTSEFRRSQIPRVDLVL
jgi:hypothetical protein